MEYLLVLGALVLLSFLGWMAWSRAQADLQRQQREQREELLRGFQELAQISREQIGDTTATVADHVQSQSAALHQLVEQREERRSGEVAEMREQLARLSQSLTALQSHTAAQHSELLTQYRVVADSASELSTVTSSLRSTLAHPKARGSWGERTAEDLFRSMGMIEGVSFLRQVRLPNGSQPDFSILLPGGRMVHLDVKFPANAYLNMLEASSEIEVQRFRTTFIRDVRQCLTDLSKRGYVDPERTVDFVILFVPNEAIFATICEFAPQLLTEAAAARVVMCAPYSLLGVLSVIRQSVSMLRVTEEAREIQEGLELFRTEWTRYSASVDKAHKQFGTLARTMDELAGTRAKQLNRRLERILDPHEKVDTEIDGSTVLSAPVLLYPEADVV